MTYTVWIEGGPGTTTGGNLGGWSQVANAQALTSSQTNGNMGKATIIVHGGQIGSLQGRRIGIVSTASEATITITLSDSFTFLGTVLEQSYDTKSLQTTLQCTEIGAEWNEIPMSGWRQSVRPDLYPDGVENEGITQANYAQSNGRIIGNMTTSGTTRLFEVDNHTAGAVWTKRALLDHGLKYALPANLSVFAFTDSDADAILNASVDEPYSLDRISLTGFLNMLCGLDRGLIWRAVYLGTTNAGVQSWTVVITTNDTDATTVAFDSESTDIVSFAQVDEPTYDQIIVEGGPCIFGNTVSITYGLREGWTEAAETTYQASGETKEDAQKIRQDPAVANVYSYFELELEDPNKQLLGSDGDDFCKIIEFDQGTELTALIATGITPDLKVSKVLSWIPWQAKTAESETGLPVSQQEAPENLGILVHNLGVNVGKPTDDSLPTPRISASTTGAGVHVAFSPQEVAAYNTWTSSMPSNFEPENPVTIGAVDYAAHLITLAIPSGQRVRIVLDNPSTDPTAEARWVRTLRINKPALECHVMRSNGIVGYDGATPIRPASDYFSRNDFPAAFAIANEAAVWAFAQRSSCTFTLAGYDNIQAYGLGSRLTSGGTDLGIVNAVTTKYGQNASSSYATIPSAYSSAVKSGGISSAPRMASVNAPAYSVTPGSPPQLPGFAKGDANNRALTMEFGDDNKVIFDAADFVDENDDPITGKEIRIRPVKACNSDDEIVWTLSLTLTEAATWAV